MIQDKLALLGMAARTAHHAKDVYDNGFELWGMNNLMREIPETWVVASRWFDIHGIGLIMACGQTGFLSPPLYCNATIPIYMIRRVDIFPTSVRYPMKEITEFFSKPVKFFNSTASIMLALAIYENRFKQINLYGIEMSEKGEYEIQRPPFYYLIAKAEDAGIEILYPPGSKLMEVQGFGEDDEPYFGMNLGNDILFNRSPDTLAARKLKRFFI